LPSKLTDFSLKEQHLADVLKRHVAIRLAVERNVKNYPDELAAAAAYLEDEIKSMGLDPRPLSYDVPKGDGSDELVKVKNIEVTIKGKEKPREVIVVGAHYDSARKTRGA
jgi:acetylornithine deacetylase/succinyl-diaminopimelate desuccinylase-like protein